MTSKQLKRHIYSDATRSSLCAQSAVVQHIESLRQREATLPPCRMCLIVQASQAAKAAKAEAKRQQKEGN